jgi:proteic killer suppression protein
LTLVLSCSLYSAIDHRTTLIITLDVINVYRYYEVVVIRTFANRATEEIWWTGKTRGSPPSGVTRRKLAMLDAATELLDLQYPPGNRLEKLRWDRQGQRSIRINNQYRICFVWRDHDAFEAEVTDYH